MKAIARLVWSYFTCTPVIRAFTFGGLAVMALAFFILMTRAQSGPLLWLAIVGYIAIFLGSALMPLMFGRLARSHSIRVLPYGRVSFSSALS